MKNPQQAVSSDLNVSWRCSQKSGWHVARKRSTIMKQTNWTTATPNTKPSKAYAWHIQSPQIHLQKRIENKDGSSLKEPFSHIDCSILRKFRKSRDHLVLSFPPAPTCDSPTFNPVSYTCTQIRVGRGKLLLSSKPRRRQIFVISKHYMT